MILFVNVYNNESGRHVHVNPLKNMEAVCKIIFLVEIRELFI